MYSWLPGAIDEGSAVITASRRLARELRHSYNQAQIGAGKRSWRSPEIRSWQGWLAMLFDSAGPLEEGCIRLPAHTSILLWEHCLREAMPERIQNFSGFVRQCWETWNRVSEWNVPLEKVAESAHPGDERLFATAAKRYQERLINERWATMTRVALLGT